MKTALNLVSMLIDSEEAHLLKTLDMLSEDRKANLLKRLDELCEEQAFENAEKASENLRQKITVSCNMLSDEI